MKSLQHTILIAALMLLPVSIAHANDAPDDIYVTAGGGGGSNQFTGYQANGGFSVQWAFNTVEGALSFAGAPGGTVDFPPYFDMGWSSPGAGFPLSVTITSNGSGLYTIKPYYILPGEAEPNLSLARTNVTGDSYFGAYFPEADQVHMAFYLLEPDVVYDLTVTMEWGEGVPNEVTSWGQVKALFR